VIGRRRGGWRAGVVRAGLAALLGVAGVAPPRAAAQEAAQRVPLPAAAVAAATAAADDSASGEHLQVAVLTVGQGEAVWELFGHNLLWIRDTLTGEEAAWNWGMFSFSEPDFLPRFLLGDTRYWMQGDDVAATLAYYQSAGREVTAQQLALSMSQRAALQAFVRANAEESARYYRYDYFLDNCSTRLRDALDLVLGGALADALGGRPTAHSYRSETLRLVQQDAWLVLGIDYALGFPADRPLTEWETAFVPMRLRDALATVSLPDGAGGQRLLVSRTVTAVRPVRPEATTTFPAAQLPWRVLMIGAAVLGLGALLGRRQLGLGRSIAFPNRLFAASVHAVLGTVAAVALAMWLFTRHSFWAWNPHLLIVTPFSLVVALTVLLRGAARMPRWVLAYHAILAGGALAVGLGVLLRTVLNDDAPGAVFSLWAHASWMMHLGAGMALAPWPWVRAGSRA
jgi:hypothetical protein